jgi:hypothetical protein
MAPKVTGVEESASAKDGMMARERIKKITRRMRPMEPEPVDALGLGNNRWRIIKGISRKLSILILGGLLM